MDGMLPGAKPKLTREEALQYLENFDTSDYPALLLGVRGYYDNGKDQIGIYDDAFFLITPDEFYEWNGNTDPSRAIPGVATLKAGEMYLYTKGIHGMHHLNIAGNSHDKAIYDQLISTGKDVASTPLTYWALRQHGNVTVIREGVEHSDSPDNRFWIDIHRGGYGTTSSLGCQTFHPDQWLDARSKIFGAMDSNNQKVIPYVLIDKV